MKKLFHLFWCLLLLGCTTEEPDAGKRADIIPSDDTELSGETTDDNGDSDDDSDGSEDDDDESEPGDDNGTSAKVYPRVDGFDWFDYGVNSVKVQFKILNASECKMQSATIYYGADSANLTDADTSWYSNGMIVATISKPTDGTKSYLVVCEIATKSMVYRTEFYSIKF